MNPRAITPYNQGHSPAPYTVETELQKKALSTLKQNVRAWEDMSEEINHLLHKEATLLTYFQELLRGGTWEDKVNSFKGVLYKGVTNPVFGVAGGASLGLLIAGPIGAGAGALAGPVLQEGVKRSSLLKGLSTSPIHVSLDMLVSTSAEYLQRLYNHLYGDKGLQTYIGALNGDTIKLEQLAISKSKERGHLSESITKSETELNDLRVEYNQKYGGDLKYEQLPTEAIELMARITHAEKDLQDKRFGLKGLEREVNTYLRTAEQNKVVRDAILVSFVQGEGLYGVVKSALAENENAIGGVTQLAKGAQLTVKSAELYAHLREFFSKALLQASQQAKTIAENAEHLVPPELIDPETLDRARGNIAEAVRTMLEKGGINPALLQLAEQSKYNGLTPLQLAEQRKEQGQLPPPE